jgi:hypothetical protein
MSRTTVKARIPCRSFDYIIYLQQQRHTIHICPQKALLLVFGDSLWFRDKLVPIRLRVPLRLSMLDPGLSFRNLKLVKQYWLGSVLMQFLAKDSLTFLLFMKETSLGLSGGIATALSDKQLLLRSRIDRFRDPWRPNPSKMYLRKSDTLK